MKRSRNLRSVIRRLGLFLAVLFLSSLAAQAQMKMHVINVGQAESVLLEFPRHAILIDAGTEETDDNRYETRLFNYLDSFFARRTDLNRTLHSVIVSHPHEDHVKSLRAVFDRFKVLHFVEGGGNVYASGWEEVRKIRNFVAENNIAHHRIYARDVKKSWFMRDWRENLSSGSEVEVKFLSAGRRCIDDNNASIVMRVVYKDRSFLFTGDAEVDDKKGRNLGCGGLIFRLLDAQASYPELLDVDVLKVAHHGSKYSTSDAFLQKVKPAFSVISAGVPETRSSGEGKFHHAWFYGHPNEAAIKLLEERTEKSRPATTVTTMTKPTKLVENRSLDRAIYCTCWDGNLVLSVDSNGSPIQIETNSNQ